MQQITSIGTWFVREPVTMTTSAGPGNPSADTVQMAFMATTANPQTGDWKTASWDQEPSGTWVAQCLVGPNGVVTLTPGTYYVWVKITDPSGEIPIEPVGTLEVT